MRSYPNLIPLSAPVIERIKRSIEPFDFDLLYGRFLDGIIPSGARRRC